MKRITIAALAFTGVVLLNSCSTTKVTTTETETTVTTDVKPTSMKEEGLNLSYIDTTVRPQDDSLIMSTETG